MNRRLQKLIEEKAWETLTDYGYNDSQLLEHLTQKVLEKLDEQQLTPGAVDVPSGRGKGGIGDITEPGEGQYVNPFLTSKAGSLPLNDPNNPEGLNGIPVAVQKRGGRIVMGSDGQLRYYGTNAGGQVVVYVWKVFGTPPRQYGKWVISQ